MVLVDLKNRLVKLGASLIEQFCLESSVADVQLPLKWAIDAISFYIFEYDKSNQNKGFQGKRTIRFVLECMF